MTEAEGQEVHSDKFIHIDCPLVPTFSFGPFSGQDSIEAHHALRERFKSERDEALAQVWWQYNAGAKVVTHYHLVTDFAIYACFVFKPLGVD